MNKSKTIAVFIDYMTNNYLVSLIDGIRKATEEHGYTLVCFEGGHLFSDKSKQNYDEMLYRLATAKNISGVILPLTSLGRIIKQLGLENLLSLFEGIPVVIIGVEVEGYSCIKIANGEGIGTIIEHLITKHDSKDFCFLEGPRHNKDSQERLESYKYSLEKHGITPDNDLIFEGDFSIGKAFIAAEKIISIRKTKNIDAVVCVNDSGALAIIEHFQKNGIQVPQDIIVTGFDNTRMAKSSNPPLTTVNQPTDLVGETAALRLLEKIEGKKEINTEEICTDFITRESCGCSSWISYDKVDFPRSNVKNIYEMILEESTTQFQSEVKRNEFLFKSLIEIILEVVETKDENRYIKKFIPIIDKLYRSLNQTYRDVNYLPLVFMSICNNLTDHDDLRFISSIGISSVHAIEVKKKELENKKFIRISQLEDEIVVYTRNLMVSSKKEDFLNACFDIIPKIGINDCLIATFNDKEGNVTKTARAVFAIKNGKPVIPINMKEFDYEIHNILPNEIWDDNNEDMIIYPIVNGYDTKGLILFSDINLRWDFCEQIYSIINYTLSNFFLIDEIELQHQEILKAQQYISNVIDSMPSILIGVDENGIVTQWNKEAERVSGIKEKEAVGLFIGKAMPHLRTISEKIDKAILSKEEQSEHKRVFFDDGDKKYEDIIIYPLTEGGIDGAVIRIDDVTKRIKMEEMIVQSEKMMSVGGLAAGMAHEINNPLAGMMQSAEVIKSRLSDIKMKKNIISAEESDISLVNLAEYLEKREILRMLDLIGESGTRAANIVSNMLSFSKNDSDAKSLNSIAEIIDKCIQLSGIDYDLKKKYDFKQIKITKEYGENIPKVPCEAAKIQQVLMNILRNGAEAMYEKNQIKESEFQIRIIEDKIDKMVRIEIEDNGSGMLEKVRKRVFEPFFTTKPTDKGTGLGLSVSYFIITESHNGEMSVESIKNVGTKFTIRLPYDEHAITKINYNSR